MKPRLLVLFVLCISLMLMQCKEDDSSSCTDNPTEDLPWLKQKIDSFESTHTEVSMIQDASVFQGKYESRTVFMIVVCCETCYIPPEFYDCAGNTLAFIDTSGIADKKLIWSLPPAVCD